MPQKKKKRKPRSRARGGAAPRAASQAAAETGTTPDKRRERLEARREAKAKAAVQEQRRRQRARFTRIAVVVGTLAVIIWFLFLRNSIPDAIAGHEIRHFDPFISESRAGTLHTDQTVSYPSIPPVSGEHSPIPADCGVHNQQVPNENMVHALEHGAVGIFFDPEKAPRGEIEDIEALVKDFDSHVFSMPYTGMDQTYAVAAWAHLMPLESYDEAAVREFIEFFREGGDSPEDQECPLSANNSFTAEPTETPTASPSPGDEETPGGDDTKRKEEKKKKNN